MHSQQHHTRRLDKSTDDDLQKEQPKEEKQIRSGGGDEGSRCNRTTGAETSQRRQQGKRRRLTAQATERERHLSTPHKGVVERQVSCSAGKSGAGGRHRRLPAVAPLQAISNLVATEAAARPSQSRRPSTTCSRSSAAAVVRPPIISDEVIACDSSQSSPDSSTASSPTFSYSATASRQIILSSSSSSIPLHNSSLATLVAPECFATLALLDRSDAGIRAESRLSASSALSSSTPPRHSLPGQSLHIASRRSHVILLHESPSTSYPKKAPSITSSYEELACQLENAKLSSSCEIDARSDSVSTPLVASFASTNHRHHQLQEEQATVASNLSCRCRGFFVSANTTNCELTTTTTTSSSSSSSSSSSFSSSSSVSSSPDGQFAKMYQRVCCDSEGHQHQSLSSLVDDVFSSTSHDSISSDSSVLAVPTVTRHVHCVELPHCSSSSSSSSNNNNNSVDKSMSTKEEQQEEEEGKSDETKEDLNSICKYLPTSDQTATGGTELVATAKAAVADAEEEEAASKAAAEQTRPVFSQATSSFRLHFQGGLFDEHHHSDGQQQQQQQHCLPPARYQIHSSPLPPSLPSLLKTEAAAVDAYRCNGRETYSYKFSSGSPVVAAFQRWTGLLFFVVLLCLLPPSADSSANIRAIEKKILDRIIGEGYDSRIRPMGNASTGVRGGDGPAVVNVNLLIRSISKIDDVIMEYSVQLTFRQTWIDSRLKFDDMNGQIRYLVLTEPGKVWRPDLFFKNEKEGHFHNIILPNVLLRIHPNGDVLYSIRISLVLACPMDLKYYPLDKQVCQIEMASYGYTTEDLMFLWKEVSPVQITTDLHLPRFTLEKYLTDYCTSTTNTGSYSCLRVSLLFKREFSYYLIQIYIPCCMLVIVSWVSFWLDPNAIPARVSLGVTTLLTMATSISGINSSLPPVSYTKAIDVWTGVCLTFVFGALLEFALVNYASRSDAHRAALKQQQAAFAAQRKWDLEQHAAAMEADHIDERGSAFAMRPLVRHREFGNHGEKMRTCEIHVSLPKRNWCKRWLSKFPTRSKRIDVISRIFFPLMFALFNLVYWTTYLFREDMHNLDKNKQ